MKAGYDASVGGAEQLEDFVLFVVAYDKDRRSVTAFLPRIDVAGQLFRLLSAAARRNRACCASARPPG